MNSATTPIIVALLGQIGLAFAVFQANPKRRSNQCFLLLSMAICVWLMYRYFGLSTRVPAVAELCIRESCATGAIILGFSICCDLPFEIDRAAGTTYSGIRYPGSQSASL
jgi:hypothetical protein